MSEHDQQVTVIQWCETAGRNLPFIDLIYAIPNGGMRNKAVAGKLKAEGVKAGMPDLCLPVPSDLYCGLYIEMKDTDGKVRKTQNEKIARLQEAGHKVVVCYSATEAIKEIQDYYGVLK